MKRQAEDLVVAILAHVLRAIAVVGSVMLVTALVLLLFGCHHPKPKMLEEPVAITEWCLSATEWEDGELWAAQGCFQTETQCRKARALGQRYGWMVQVEHLGECRRSSMRSKKEVEERLQEVKLTAKKVYEQMQTAQVEGREEDERTDRALLYALYTEMRTLQWTMGKPRPEAEVEDASSLRYQLLELD